MLNMHHSGFIEIKKKITESISQAFKIIAGPERRSVERGLALLASDRTIPRDAMRAILDFYRKGDEQKEAFFGILASLEPQKAEYVMNQIYAAMDTPEWLITLRSNLLNLLKKRQKAVPDPLKGLAGVFTDYFAKIFNFQYLVTRCCNAQNTSISLLKFISEKEGVHPAEHWWDFENRLNSPDRIIISLEHFKMPYVPLVYVEVAFSRGLIRKISRIIGEKRRPPDLSHADSAIFYSLNTTLGGLGGIALGAKMLIRARDHIQANYPHITHFATLSPIPRFRDYLAAVLREDGHAFALTRTKIDRNRGERFATKAEIRALTDALSPRGGAGTELSKLLEEALAPERWYENAAIRGALAGPLAQLTRYYLAREKRIAADGRTKTTNAYDPVAHFHLSNGAYAGSIDYLANTSPKGMRESFGMMVNYVYDAGRQEKNKLLYRTGKVVLI